MANQTAAHDLYDLYLSAATVAERLTRRLGDRADVQIPNPADLLVDAPDRRVWLAATPLDWSTVWAADPSAEAWRPMPTGLAADADDPDAIASAISAAFDTAADLPARLHD